jgi:hypothetical protein
MTAAKKAKELGLPSLKIITDVTGKSRATLHDWNKHNAELFEVVCLGVKVKIESLNGSNE